MFDRYGRPFDSKCPQIKHTHGVLQAFHTATDWAVQNWSQNVRLTHDPYTGARKAIFDLRFETRSNQAIGQRVLPTTSAEPTVERLGQAAVPRSESDCKPDSGANRSGIV